MSSIFVCDFERLLREHHEFRSEICYLKNLTDWLAYDNEILERRVRTLEVLTGLNLYVLIYIRMLKKALHIVNFYKKGAEIFLTMMSQMWLIIMEIYLHDQELHVSNLKLQEKYHKQVEFW